VPRRAFGDTVRNLLSDHRAATIIADAVDLRLSCRLQIGLDLRQGGAGGAAVQAEKAVEQRIGLVTEADISLLDRGIVAVRAQPVECLGELRAALADVGQAAAERLEAAARIVRGAEFRVGGRCQANLVFFDGDDDGHEPLLLTVARKARAARELNAGTKC